MPTQRKLNAVQPVSPGTRPGRRASLPLQEFPPTGLHVKADSGAEHPASPRCITTGAGNSSPSLRPLIRKTMKVNRNQQLKSHRYQFSHPRKINHLMSLNGKLSRTREPYRPLSTPPGPMSHSPDSSSTKGGPQTPANMLASPAFKVRILFLIPTVPPFKAGADISKAPPASQRRKPRLPPERQRLPIKLERVSSTLLLRLRT